MIFKIITQNIREVKFGSGDGLVPSGNKPLPVPKLTQFYVAMWHHKATMPGESIERN